MTFPFEDRVAKTVNQRRGYLHPGEEGEREEPALTLAAQLAAQMDAAWRQGQHPCVEEYLNRHGELVQSPRAVRRLIEQEIVLRAECGQPVGSAEFEERFARWQPLPENLPGASAVPAEPRFPGVGETLEDLRLLAELGRGVLGRVFLALQSDLAYRPVVLKMSPCEGQEHLTLARLQHTHIVPLYWVHDLPERNLRVLAMPYLGGATWKELLEALAPIPCRERSGQDLLRALDRVQALAPLTMPGKGMVRQYLAQASYIQAVCSLGTCLAEALHYAHERGLVHLDLKPSNVLLAADGQPMLLDFHLARAPVQPHGPAPAWFGGTPAYMSPEQRDALTAFQTGKPIPCRVDGRSDVYSLGVLLYEALGGTPAPAGAGTQPWLHHCNPQVSIGLSDVVHKCLADDPAGRYADAADLAADLRRHLGNLPLRGVANRSLGERWRKWRRRRPYTVVLIGALLLAMTTVSTLAVIGWGQVSQRRQEAEAALADSRNRLREHDYAGAARMLAHALELARETPGSGDQVERLAGELNAVRQAEAANHLHRLVERLRYLYAAPVVPWRQQRALADRCREVWSRRALIVERLRIEPSRAKQALEADLLDLAIFLADLEVRLAERAAVRSARGQALAILAEARTLFGPSPTLAREQEIHAAALGRKELARDFARLAEQQPPRTSWEFYVRGRFHLLRGDLKKAAADFKRALEGQPQQFWLQFYYAVCCHRLARHADALTAFHVCVALAPQSAECYYNRALTYAALGNKGQALQDYSRALEIRPDLTGAALNRGILHYERKQFAEAEADLRRALHKGADAATVYYNLAVVELARKKRASALVNVRQALTYRPDYQEARALRDRLQGKQ